VKSPKGFTRFLTLAGVYLKDPRTRLRLLSAAKEYAHDKGHLIKGFQGDLRTLVSLIKDWNRGIYTDVSKKTILLVIAALLYFISPLDTIPDFLGAVGFTDDAAVILFVLNSIKNELGRYQEWRGHDKH
jgi:uncharacterized membrane protein YkvA (DUF1232 family)